MTSKIIDNNALNLSYLFKVVRASYRVLIFFILTGSLLGVIFSLSLPNQFISTAKLAPSDSYESSSSLGGASGASAISGLASLAGITAGTTQEMDRTQLAIETIQSKDFFSYFLTKRALLPEIMYGKSFNKLSNKLNVDSKYFDQEKNIWNAVKPLHDEAHDVFYSNFVISKDRRTGVIYMSYKNTNPIIAQTWLQYLLTDLNEYMRAKDMTQYKKSIAYLNEKILDTNLPDIKKGLAAFILSSTQKLMLSEISEEYAFKNIEKPTLPIKKSSPRRSLICVIAAILGFIVGVILVTALHVSNRKIDIRKKYPFFVVIDN